MLAKKEELALFELEIQFEEAAADPRLTAAERQQQMQAVLERMHATVMTGYRVNAYVGQHLASLALDYLGREDVGVAVVKNAFNRSSNSSRVVGLYEHMMLSEMRRTVARIEGYKPAKVAMALS